MEYQEIVDPIPPNTGGLAFLHTEFNLLTDAGTDDFDIDNVVKEYLNLSSVAFDSDPLTDSHEFDPSDAIVYNSPSLFISYQAPADQIPCVYKLLNMSSPESSLNSANRDSQASGFETPKRYVSESSSHGSGNCEPNLCEELNSTSPVPSNYQLCSVCCFFTYKFLAEEKTRN